MSRKTLRVISWNVNGLRSAIKHGFFEFVKKYEPDVLCLQETKANRGQVELDLPCYEEYWNSAARKGYAGTAIFTKTKPAEVSFDLKVSHPEQMRDKFGDVLEEGRVITADFGKFYLVNVYTPNAKRGLERLELKHKKWDPAFLGHIKQLDKIKPVIVCGDFNVAHQGIDIARPKENIGNAGFTDEEREGFDKIMSSGFVDSFRRLHPNEVGAYSWWSHFAKAKERNIGWRIDYVCVSGRLTRSLEKAFILPNVIGSDHCPVGIEINLKSRT
jgi:exodeoxyribonuclease-3